MESMETPPVQFDDNHPPDNIPIELGTGFEYVLDDRYPYSDSDHNLLQLSLTIAMDGCSGILPGAPEAAYVGTTINDANGNMEYWLHTTSFTIQSNTLEEPLVDGGRAAMNATESATFDRQRAVCSNAPRTFLNEDYCVLSNDACYQDEGPDVDIELNLANLELMHYSTGGAGGPDTVYGKFIGNKVKNEKIQ